MAGARRNLELKAVDPAPERTLAAALALTGVEDLGVLSQRDTYFHAVEGRLKLREAPPAVAQLISYRRADRGGPKVSHYRIVPVYDPDALAESLGDVLGVRAVVEKERRLLVWRGVRIHRGPSPGGAWLRGPAGARGPVKRNDPPRRRVVPEGERPPNG